MTRREENLFLGIITHKIEQKGSNIPAYPAPERLCNWNKLNCLILFILLTNYMLGWGRSKLECKVRESLLRWTLSNIFFAIFEHIFSKSCVPYKSWNPWYKEDMYKTYRSCNPSYCHDKTCERCINHVILVIRMIICKRHLCK